MNSARTTLIASIIASAAGIGAWLLGMGNLIWPAHPQIAVFFLTIVCTVVLMITLPSKATPPGGQGRSAPQKHF
jgi:uncharacterized membrane protein